MLTATLLAAMPGGIAGIAIWLIIAAAVVAIVFIATRAMGVPIPPWVMHVLMIVFIAIVCIFAIKFLIMAI